MTFQKHYTWACDHLKTSNLSADNFHKILDFDGSKPKLAMRSSDTSRFWQLSIDHNIDVQNVCIISFPVLPN